MRIYLDNCCYNRPYDDQSQMQVSLETQAKLYIQEMVREKKYELATAYILRYENNANPFNIRRTAIDAFIQKNSSVYVGFDKASDIDGIAKEVMSTGVKAKDAIHVACAIYAGCDYFISTDKRLLKYRTDRIRIVDPLEFIRMEENNDE